MFESRQPAAVFAKTSRPLTPRSFPLAEWVRSCDMMMTFLRFRGLRCNSFSRSSGSGARAGLGDYLVQARRFRGKRMSCYGQKIEVRQEWTEYGRRLTFNSGDKDYKAVSCGIWR